MTAINNKNNINKNNNNSDSFWRIHVVSLKKKKLNFLNNKKIKKNKMGVGVGIRNVVFSFKYAIFKNKKIPIPISVLLTGTGTGTCGSKNRPNWVPKLPNTCTKPGRVPKRNQTGFYPGHTVTTPGEPSFETGDQNQNYIIPSSLSFSLSLSLSLTCFTDCLQESVTIALSTSFSSNFVFEWREFEVGSVFPASISKQASSRASLNLRN